MVKKKIPTLFGNLTPVIQPVASHLTEDMVQYQALVNMVMNLQAL
jgi:hypothetical protein